MQGLGSTSSAAAPCREHPPQDAAVREHPAVCPSASFHQRQSATAFGSGWGFFKFPRWHRDSRIIAGLLLISAAPGQCLLDVLPSPAPLYQELLGFSSCSLPTICSLSSSPPPVFRGLSRGSFQRNAASIPPCMPCSFVWGHSVFPWPVLMGRVTSVLAVQGGRGRQVGAARNTLHPQLSPDGIWQHRDPIFAVEHWPFQSGAFSTVKCGGMGHMEWTHSTSLLLLHPEGWGKGGISISAKLGQVLQHWLANLTVEKQRGIQKIVGKP